MVTNGGGQSHTPAQSRKVVLKESELLQVADKHQFSLTLMDPLNLTDLGSGGVNCDSSRGISHAPNSSTENVYFGQLDSSLELRDQLETFGLQFKYV